MGYATRVSNIRDSGWVNGSGFSTGVSLAVLLSVITIFAIAFRKSGGWRYKLFQTSHLLVVPFEIILLVHGRYYWIWFLPCVVIYLMDLGLRFFYFRRMTVMEKAEIHCDSKSRPECLYIQLKRPKGFKFDPGSFIWLRVPSLETLASKTPNTSVIQSLLLIVFRVFQFLTRSGQSNEFHPFTLCSAPEDEDNLCLAIRTCGDWTEALYHRCERELKQSQEGLLRIEILIIITHNTSVMTALSEKCIPVV